MYYPDEGPRSSLCGAHIIREYGEQSEGNRELSSFVIMSNARVCRHRLGCAGGGRCRAIFVIVAAIIFRVSLVFTSIARAGRLVICCGICIATCSIRVRTTDEAPRAVDDTNVFTCKLREEPTREIKTPIRTSRAL